MSQILNAAIAVVGIEPGHSGDEARQEPDAN
jgi:hypothetical protein